MEITPSTIYWIMQLDQLHDCLCGVAVVGDLLTLILSIIIVALVVNEEISKAKALGIEACMFLIFLLFSAAAAFIPDTKTAIAMYCIPKAINSEVAVQLQGDAKELYTLGVERLKKELKGETDGTKKP